MEKETRYLHTMVVKVNNYLKLVCIFNYEVIGTLRTFSTYIISTTPVPITLTGPSVITS